METQRRCKWRATWIQKSRPFSQKLARRQKAEGRRLLFPCPARLPLLKEGGDSFLRVGGEGVHAHDLLGVGVSLRLVEIDLRVERLLAQRDRERTGFGNALRQLAGLLLKL